MNGFSSQLINTRARLGHKTAKAFFLLMKKRGISFNYPYYMRLEQGERLPSEKVVNEIALALGREVGEALVLAYCQTIFPKFQNLFDSQDVQSIPATMKNTYVPGGQKELSPKQVATLRSQESNYHLFLLVTLSRKQIPLTELENFFSDRQLNSAVKALCESEIIQLGPHGVEALAVEARFPEAQDQFLKDAYAQFDKWDEKFGEAFGLERFINKMMIRRISGRYLGIIRKHLEVLFEMIKSSDETDLRHNDRVLKLRVTIEEGKLPG